MLLVAGDKSGKGERAFYRRLIATADKAVRRPSRPVETAPGAQMTGRLKCGER